MRIVRFLLLFVGLASQKSPHPEKWRQRLQALLYNYRHSAIESRGEKQERQDAPINCDNSENSDKQCLLDPAKYFANMVFTLNFRIGALDSFEKRYKRLTKFVKVIRGKASKNATFESVTGMLLDSLGGNPNNFTCLGEEERLATNANVSKGFSIPKYENFGNLNTTWKRCEKMRKEIVQKSDRCRLSEGEAKCFCYEGLDLLVGQFKREKCSDIKEDERKTVVEKGLCLDAFRACRQMENEAFFTINQCDHKTVDLIIESNRSLRDVLEDEEDDDDEDYDLDYEEDYPEDEYIEETRM